MENPAFDPPEYEEPERRDIRPSVISAFGHDTLDRVPNIDFYRNAGSVSGHRAVRPSLQELHDIFQKVSFPRTPSYSKYSLSLPCTTTKGSLRLNAKCFQLFGLWFQECDHLHCKVFMTHYGVCLFAMVYFSPHRMINLQNGSSLLTFSHPTEHMISHILFEILNSPFSRSLYVFVWIANLRKSIQILDTWIYLLGGSRKRICLPVK